MISLKEKSCQEQDLTKNENKFLRTYIEKNIDVPDSFDVEGYSKSEPRGSFKRFACNDIVLTELEHWRYGELGIVEVEATLKYKKEKKDFKSYVCYVHDHDDNLEQIAKRKFLSEWFACAQNSGTDHLLIKNLNKFKDSGLFRIEDQSIGIEMCTL